MAPSHDELPRSVGPSGALARPRAGCWLRVSVSAIRRPPFQTYLSRRTCRYAAQQVLGQLCGSPDGAAPCCPLSGPVTLIAAISVAVELARFAGYDFASSTWPKRGVSGTCAELGVPALAEQATEKRAEQHGDESGDAGDGAHVRPLAA